MPLGNRTGENLSVSYGVVKLMWIHWNRRWALDHSQPHFASWYVQENHWIKYSTNCMTTGLNEFTSAQTFWVLSHLIYCLFLWRLVYILVIFLTSPLCSLAVWTFWTLWVLTSQFEHFGGNIHLNIPQQRSLSFLQIQVLELLPRYWAEILLYQSAFWTSLIILFSFLI